MQGRVECDRMSRQGGYSPAPACGVGSGDKGAWRGRVLTAWRRGSTGRSGLPPPGMPACAFPHTLRRAARPGTATPLLSPGPYRPAVTECGAIRARFRDAKGLGGGA